ncbi:hypothetical protein [Parabacteroides sp. PF5-9]|uniref:hypothetical protein n=1 Tax=Parabacteroides sp. PF5-9 TaxID=1742404 RepID=UPI002473762E|nr:hypothetical protein [Parabacteroides sp. PF5-9]MDH6358335.1 hypothetical protein [Parabacteroides sp. PF5-9]
MPRVSSILATILFLFLIACSEKDIPGVEVPKNIQLYGAIGTTTRSVIDADYPYDLPLGFVRRDEISSGNYGLWHLSPAVRQGGTGNKLILFSETQEYPEDDKQLHLLGYYPADAHLHLAQGYLSFDIDGETDILSTGRLTGCMSSPFNACVLEHLLTQLQFVCYTDDLQAWGNLIRIEVDKVKTPLVLDLENPTQLKPGTTSQEVSVPVKNLDNLQIPFFNQGKKPDPQGYVLLPVSIGGQDIPIQLKLITSKNGRGVVGETTHNTEIYIEGGVQAGFTHRVELLFSGEGELKIHIVSVEEWIPTPGGMIKI